MTFLNKFKAFIADDSGAVTVDWVVLTAAIVGLGIAVIASVSGGVRGLGGEIADSLNSGTVATVGALGAGAVGGGGTN